MPLLNSHTVNKKGRLGGKKKGGEAQGKREEGRHPPMILGFFFCRALGSPTSTSKTRKKKIKRRERKMRRKV